MKEKLCSAYMKDAGNDKQYYEIFFEMCRKFRIDWATADEKEKEFSEKDNSVVRSFLAYSCRTYICNQ